MYGANGPVGASHGNLVTPCEDGMRRSASLELRLYCVALGNVSYSTSTLSAFTFTFALSPFSYVAEESRVKETS